MDLKLLQCSLRASHSHHNFGLGYALADMHHLQNITNYTVLTLTLKSWQCNSPGLLAGNASNYDDHINCSLLTPRRCLMATVLWGQVLSPKSSWGLKQQPIDTVGPIYQQTSQDLILVDLKGAVCPPHFCSTIISNFLLCNVPLFLSIYQWGNGQG